MKSSHFSKSVFLYKIAALSIVCAATTITHYALRITHYLSKFINTINIDALRKSTPKAPMRGMTK